MKSLIGRRVEQLESRCLLSVASFSDHLNADVRESFVTERIAGGGLAAELQLPQSELPLFEVPPIQLPYLPDTEPAGGDLDSFVPPDETEKEMAPDGGGQIELGDYGDSGGGAGDVTPADVRGDRESRAVLQMLARLKYPLEEAANRTAAATSEFDVADPSASAPGTDSSRVDSVRADERSIDIAVSELAEEFADVPAHVRSGESLLDVDVQMDRAAGRYQAFEVLTIDPAAAWQNSRDTHSGVPAFPAATTDEFSQHGGPVASPVQSNSATTLPTNLTTEATTVEGASPLAFLYTLVDEKFGTTWTRAISLVLFGLVIHLVRPHFQSPLQDDHDERNHKEADDPQQPRRYSGWGGTP